MQILPFILLILYVLVIPVGLCFLWERHPGCFRGGKLFLWIAGLTVFSWCGVVGAILIPYCCGLFIPRIDGSFTSVMGLPVVETAALLAPFGISLP